MTTRSFELIDGKSDKFWTITLDREQYTVQFGRRGTAGQTQSKDLGSLDGALQAYDKLVAEKLKKGYKEVRTGHNGSGSPKPAVPAAPPKPADTAEAPSAPPSPSAIRLQPWEWMIATWRPREAVPKPAPKPFDRQAALALFRRWAEFAIKDHWWAEGWNRLELPPSMSPEEARFWFHAILALMRVMYLGHPPAGTAADWNRELHAEAERGIQQLGALDLSRELSQGDAFEMMARKDFWQDTGRPGALLLIPLLNLYPVSEVAEVLAEASCHSPWHDLGEDCLRANVYRHLSDADWQLLRAAVRRRLPGHTCTPIRTRNRYGDASSNYIFRLAAVLGGGEELTKAVEGWPADGYVPFARSQKRQDIVFGLPSARLVSQHMHRLKYALTTSFHIQAWVAHTELAELDLIRDSIVEVTNRKEAAELAETFGRIVVAPEAAPTMLSLALESKAPQVARAWFMDHPAETIAGLAPLSAGKGKYADAAIDILRDLDRAGHGAAIESRLAPAVFQKVAAYRKAAMTAASAAVLAAESTPAGLAAALEEAGRIKAKLPTWAAVALLPPILTADGRLNGDQTTTVLRALANSVLPVPHPLLLALIAYATPASLDEFSWALFERWLAEGGPAKEKWALGAVGLYGGDQSAIALASMIRVWPGQGKHQTAVLGLECLRAIGTDTALIQISGIAQRVKFQAIKARAQECMEAIAADLNLTRPQLEDRVVPDCGLNENGSRVFDFGPRQFRLILAPGMKPLVVDADNQRKPDLPKPNSKDDPEKAEEAVAAWKLAKKQLAEAVKVQTRRLEQALVTQRRWTPDEFESLFLRHPLMMNLAPWLVWGGFQRGGKLVVTFRVTEDRSLADERDRPVTLPADVAIGLVHPMQLAPASLAAWGELLSDYEILPPFPQLGRPILRLTESEARGNTIERHKGILIPAASLVGGLDRLGWQRGPVEDAGMYHWHGKHFYELGFSAILEHEPIVIGMLADSDATPLNACYFTAGECETTGWGSSAERIALREVDPLILSEVLSDLQALASKGKDS